MSGYIYKPNTCGTCKHFRQHYGRRGKRYHMLFCGHCVYPGLKNRSPDQTCKHWTEKPQEDKNPK